MCPMIAGTISSLKFPEIQSHSMSLGFSREESSCRRAKLPTGESLYGVYGQQPLLAAFRYDAFGAAGPDDLRERILYGQLLAYAGQVVGAAVRRLELHFPHPGER